MPAENYYCLDNFFKKMTDLDSPKKNNDCYFYYYSTCAKGDSCTFRHEPSALGCETMCSFWKEGKCVNVHCNFRHMELRKNRKAIPCYWESQPMGCLKAHCPFMHQNPRPSDVNRSNISTDQSGDMNSTSDRRVTAVDSLVVNFEEESDNESTPTFSPKKSAADWIVTVKSLDEIRLEKIQAESAAYYEYNSPFLTCNEDENNDATIMRQRIVTRMTNKSIPERIVTVPKRVSDNHIISPIEKKRKIVYRNEDGNLEIILNKNSNNYYSNENFRNVSDMEVDRQISVTFPVSLETRRVNPLKSCSNTRKTTITDIKIKTLDEIRRDRKAKDRSKEEQEVTSTSTDTDSKSTEESRSAQNKKKIVLRRHIPSSTGTRENICDTVSSISDISTVNNLNQLDVQKNIDTESICSKLDEDVYLLGDDDFDDETMLLKPEEELLDEIDACLNN